MRTLAPGHSKRPTGFTLIEVLVVVVIIAVATAAGLNMLRPSHADLNTTGRHLASWLERLASEARLSGLATSWRCDMESPSQIVFEQLSLEPRGGAQWKLWSESAGRSLPDDIRVVAVLSGGLAKDCRERRVMPPFGLGERWSVELQAREGGRLNLSGDGLGRVVVTSLPTEGT